MHDVRQVQHERRLGHVHRRAVRLERVGDRADGVLVLLEVLRRPRQRGGQREVALVVAGTPDGAGQHARGDQAALAADQHLRGRAEHPVDVEGPAHRVVAARRPSGQRTSMGASAVAIRSRASTTFSRSPASMRRRRRPRPPSSARCRARRRRRPRPRGPTGALAGPSYVAPSSARADQGEPGAAAAPADHDPRDRQHRVARLVGETERAEADQAGAGLVDLVADHGAGARSRSTTCRRRRSGCARGCGSGRRRPSRPGPRRGGASVTGRRRRAADPAAGHRRGARSCGPSRLLVTVGKRTGRLRRADPATPMPPTSHCRRPHDQ